MSAPVRSFKFKFTLGLAAVLSLLLLTGAAGVLQVIADGRSAPVEPVRVAAAPDVVPPDELRHEALNQGAVAAAAAQPVAVSTDFSPLWEPASGGGPLVSSATKARVLGLQD